MSVRAVSVRRRRKAMAIIAGGTALGIAGLVTLAAWNDNEWVFGGTSADGGDGVGTSSFNVQQNAWGGGTAPTTASTFSDHEDNPGNELIFDVDPSGLTPGDTIYAPVALTTTADSIAGELQLTPAIAAIGKTAVDAGDALWDALTYSVRVTDVAETAENCTPTGFASAGTQIVADQALDAAITDAPQALSAERGNVQYYCFAISLPAAEADNQDLQGRVVFPAWRFAATSN
jgi:predicted ribosomally synthesized peptide with SipW-like signal peptide